MTVMLSTAKSACVDTSVSRMKSTSHANTTITVPIGLLVWGYIYVM